MPEPLTFTEGMLGGLQFVFAGWVAYIPIWVVAKFSMM